MNRVQTNGAHTNQPRSPGSDRLLLSRPHSYPERHILDSREPLAIAPSVSTLADHALIVPCWPALDCSRTWPWAVLDETLLSRFIGLLWTSVSLDCDPQLQPPLLSNEGIFQMRARYFRHRRFPAAQHTFRDEAGMPADVQKSSSMRRNFHLQGQTESGYFVSKLTLAYP